MTRALFLFPRDVPTEPGMLIERVLTPITPQEKYYAARYETVWRVFLWDERRKWFGTFCGPHPLTLDQYRTILADTPSAWVEFIACA